MKAPMKAVPLACYRCSLKNSLEIFGTRASMFVFREKVRVKFEALILLCLLCTYASMVDAVVEIRAMFYCKKIFGVYMMMMI